MLKLLYQTVEDRGNPEVVESSGPFPCNKHPWLTPGFYFWDTSIEWAHWWGKQGYGGSYIISQYKFEYNHEEIYDLLDPTFLAEFRSYAKILERDTRDSDISVPQVIAHMREHTSFPYKGVRAEGRFSASYSDNPELNQSMPFVKMKLRRTRARLDMLPSVQICLFSKESLKGIKGTIVFPEEYINIEGI